MSRLPIILRNCHGNLPTSWHDSHGGKWSKTFCITVGSRKSRRQMEGGAWCLPGCAVGALPREIGWQGRWPVLTSLHPAEGTKSSSAVPDISLTAGYVAAANLPEPLVPSASLAAGLVSVGLASTLHRDPGAVTTPTWLSTVRGTSRGSQFLQWEGCPEFPRHEEWENLCCTPPGSRGAFWGNEQPWGDDHLHPLTQVTTVKILC